MSTHVLQPALDALKHEFDVASQQAAERAQADLLHRLNQLLRRFRQYQNEGEWLQALLDGAASFAPQVAIFAIEDGSVRLRAQSNLHLPTRFSFPLTQARAFAAACELKDPVTSLRTPSEVTGRLSENHAGERAHLFPIANGTRVVAILFAAAGSAENTTSPIPNSPDMNALEMLCGIAATVLERQSNSNLHAQIAPAAPPAPPVEEPPPPPPTPPTPLVIPPVLPRANHLPSWTDLAGDQRQLHLRAQRFARVTVAEMQLARPEACKAGREQADLYLFLKREIDKARESYRKQFMTVPSMVDYLHLELIHTAAEGDEHKLGVDYPGQLL